MCSPGGAGLLDIKPGFMENLMRVAALLNPCWKC